MANDEVGGITGFLRLDRTDWNAGFDEAEARIDRLTGRNVNVRVDIDIAGALAALRALQTEEDRVSANTVRVQKSANDATGKKGVGGLITAALALGPAIGPIAAAAAGAGGALVLMGAAGILAFKGIDEQMKDSTALGAQYQTGLSELQTDLSQLEATAAGGFLNPFNDAVRTSRGLLPGLNSEIGFFSQSAGVIASHILPGVIDGFHTLQPLFQFVATGLEHGAVGFEHWSASTGGVVKFAAYAQAVLPQVVSVLSELVQAAVKIGVAFSSTGVAALSVLGMVARLINALPLGVLQALVITIIAGVTAWKLYAGLSWVSAFYERTTAKMAANAAATEANTAAQARLAAATTAAGVASLADAAAQDRLAVAQLEASNATGRQAGMLGLAGASSAAYAAASGEAWVATTRLAVAQAAATGSAEALAIAEAELAAAELAAGEAGAVASGGIMAALGPVAIIAGIAAVAIGAFGFANAKSSAQAQKNASAIQSLTSALEDSNGAITQNIRDMTAKALNDAGALAAARKLGISLQTVTDAALGNSDAMATVKAATDAATKAGVANAGASALQGSSHDQAALAATGQTVAAKALMEVLTNQNSVVNQSIQGQKDLAAADAAATAAQELSASASARAGSALNATASEYDAAKSAVAQTATQLAATTLQMRIQGDTAGLLQQALDKLNGKQLNVQEATTQLAQSLLNNTKTLKDNGDTIDLSTQKGIDNRNAITDQVKAIQAMDVANQQSGMSVKDATTQFANQRQEFLDNIAASEGLISKNKNLTQAQNDAKTAVNESKSAAYQYALTLLTIPTQVDTKADFDAAAAIAAAGRLKTAYDIANDAKQKVVGGVTTTIKSSGGHASQGASASGDVNIQGPGTKTSDSILWSISKGESVITADATARNYGALQAANNGATLTVAGPSPSSPAARSVRATTPPPAATPAGTDPAVVQAIGVLGDRIENLTAAHAQATAAAQYTAALAGAQATNTKAGAGSRR